MQDEQPGPKCSRQELQFGVGPPEILIGLFLGQSGSPFAPEDSPEVCEFLLGKFGGPIFLTGMAQGYLLLWVGTDPSTQATH